MLTLAAVAALAAAPAFAQNATERRTEAQAPAAGQVRGTATQEAGQTQPGVGAQRTNRFAPRDVGQGQGRALAGQAGVNDGLFAAAATDGNLSELTLSQLGVQKATDPELKRFSQQMIDEHTRMGQEMKTMLAQKGLRVPEMVDVRSQFCAESLAGLSGEDFDRCYAKAQLVAHMDSVAMFEAEAERGTDPDVKALAAKALPHIKSHLKTIKPIAQRYMKEKEGEESSHNQTGTATQRPIR